MKRASPSGTRSPWQTWSEMPASHARQGWSDTRVGASARRSVGWPGRPPCPPLPGAWGAAERGWGREYHATSPMPLESSMLHTGAFAGEGKARGTEARETPTKRPSPPGESDGASSSAHGPAVDTRMRTEGDGPEPVGRRRTKRKPRTQYPAHAPAVPSWEGMLAKEEEAQRHASVKAVARETDAS